MNYWLRVRPVLRSSEVRFRRAVRSFIGKPVLDDRTKRVKFLSERLWGGFSGPALPKLELIARSTTAMIANRIDAAWELARWHSVTGDLDAALTWLDLIASIDPAARFTQRYLLLEVDLLLRKGESEQARALPAKKAARDGYNTDLYMAAANTLLVPVDARRAHSTDDERLALINHTFVDNGYLPIRKRDPQRALTIDNVITAVPADAFQKGGPKISVIMPARNAETTIEHALDGLLSQTWENIEVLVVDDASSDGTRDIVTAIAARDSRVRLINQGEALGAYIARNRGLANVTGDYVTVHDADDWSHAQKLEAQIRQFEMEDLVAATSSWVRVDWNLRFNSRWPPKHRLIYPNYSSLMLRASTIRELGGWDSVRTGADNELILRLEAIFGTKRVRKLLHNIPLSFGLETPTSLTRHSDTHLRTLRFGSRQEYRRSAVRWHAAAAVSGDFRVDPDPAAARKFPAPWTELAGKREAAEYDVLLVSDLALKGGSFVSTYNYALAAIKAGLRIGVFHWPHFDLDPDRFINERLATLIDQFKVDVVVADQPLKTKHLIFYYPPIFEYAIDRIPKVSFEKMYVIVNQMATRLVSGEDPQYDPSVVRKNLESLFGSAGEWFPISTLVRDLMLADARYPPPAKEIWTPLLETDFWCAPKLRWRGATGAAPVLGRHGRNHYTKWPKTRKEIEDAYCLNQKWEARFLGGAGVATDILGRQPGHWTILEFDAVDVREFLGGLDFLVHFPREDYIEEFGRCAMEAMAVGIPVILPPRFASSFGDAASYCEPAGVADRIRELWSSEERYLNRARAGREFVLQNCSLEQFGRRLLSAVPAM